MIRRRLLSGMPGGIRIPRRRSKLSARENRWGWFFILPFVSLFTVFGLLPIGIAGWLSFVDWHPLATTPFVAFRNYQALLANAAFRKAIWNSFYYAVMTVPAGIALALFIAILIHSLRSGAAKSLWQAVFYLPGVVSGIAVAIIWRFMFDYEHGLLNYFVTSLFGIERVAWLGNVHTALPSLALMALLSSPGGAVIIFVAALGGIPKDLYEAAELDGAGFWRRHSAVTLPLIVPSFLYIFVMSTLGAMQVFVPIWLLTRGGPVYSTMTVAYFIYNQLMYYNNAGTAAAGGVVLLALTVGFTILQFRAFAQVVEF